MDCEDFREALSARLDNEDVADADQPTEDHLEYCADCAFWYDAAALITRRTRTTAAVAWPDVSDAVLARVPAGGERTWPRLRLALGTVGLLQLGTGVVTLTALPGGGYETGAFQVALGVALGAVAIRRVSHTALVPLLGTLVAVLAFGAVTGVHANGLVSLVLAAAGLALVVLLGRMPPEPGAAPTPKPASNHLRRASGDPAANNAGVTRLTIRVSRSAKSA